MSQSLLLDMIYQQISLLWYRAIGDPDHKRIFCLVNGQKLPYQVCVDAFEEMDRILEGETGKLYLLCINYIPLHLLYLTVYRLSTGGSV